MLIHRILLIPLLLSCCTVTSGPSGLSGAEESFYPVFEPTAASDGLVVVREHSDYGRAIGLEIGDEVLAVQGWRVWDPESVRFLLIDVPATQATVPMHVRRHGKIVQLDATHPISLAPQHRLLHLAANVTAKADLAAIGLSPAQEAFLPGRLRVALRSLDIAKLNARQQTWLQKFFTAYHQTVIGNLTINWPDDPGPTEEWTSWATHYQDTADIDGIFPLADKQAGIRFLALYPWRGLSRPAIGKLNFGDNEFNTTIANTFANEDWYKRIGQSRVYQQAGRETTVDGYLAMVKAAILNPAVFEPWLCYRAVQIARPEQRSATIEELTARIGLGGDRFQLHCFALIPALLNDQRAEEAAALIRILGNDSPWLAARALQAAMHISEARNLPQVPLSLSEHLPDMRIDTRVEDGFEEWLLLRDKNLDQALAGKHWHEDRLSNRRLQARLLPYVLSADGYNAQAQLEHAQLMRQINNTAWDFATDERLADKAACVFYLDFMLKNAIYELPSYQRDTIAALYARAGNFPAAVHWQQWCIKEISELPDEFDRNEQLPDYSSRLPRYHNKLVAVEVIADDEPEIVIEQWPDGSKQQAQTMYGDDATGPTQHWYENGTVRGKGFSIDGTKHGPWVWYHQDGSKSLEVSYRKGLPTGPATWYRPDGSVFCTGVYLNTNRPTRSQRTGEWSWFHENGKLALRGRYLNGSRSGAWLTATAAGEQQSVSGPTIEPPAVSIPE